MKDGLPPRVFSLALKLILESEGKKLLDIGAGEGLVSHWVKKHGKEPRGCDIAPARFNVPGVKCDAVDLNKELPYASNSFDIVAGTEVLEHVDNHMLIFNEVHRILKKGGVFVFTTPNVNNWYSKLCFLFAGYFPYFSDADYRTIGHIHPLIFNIFKNHIKGRFVIDKMLFNRSIVPLLHLTLPWRNLFFGETMIVKLRKV